MENEDSKGKTLKPALSGEWGVNTASRSSWTYDWNKISCRIFVIKFSRKNSFPLSAKCSREYAKLGQISATKFSPFEAKFFPFCQKKGKTCQTNIKS